MVSRKGKIIGVLKRSFIALEHCNQLTFVVQVLVLRASQKKKKTMPDCVARNHL